MWVWCASPKPPGRMAGSGGVGADAAPVRTGDGGGDAGRVGVTTGGDDAAAAFFFALFETADIKSLSLAALSMTKSDISGMLAICQVCNMKRNTESVISMVQIYINNVVSKG